MAKSKKEVALEKLTPKQREAYDAVAAAGKAGIEFEPLRIELSIKTANMLYHRLGGLEKLGLLKVVKAGRKSTYTVT